MKEGLEGSFLGGVDESMSKEIKEGVKGEIFKWVRVKLKGSGKVERVLKGRGFLGL